MDSGSGHPFQERVRYLYNNKKMSDFCFIVGPTQTEIPGHKFLFSIVSDVFYEMFYADDENDNLEINVPEISYFSFMEFMKYIYINDLLLTQKIVTDILQLSVDYKMTDLMRRCVEYLRTNLYIRNVLFVLQLSIKFEMFELKDKCLEVIGLNSEKLFKDSEFLNIEEDMLKVILKTNHFVCSEYEIFSAAMNWAKKACEKRDMPPYLKNMRHALDNCWNCIRFDIMTHDDFKKVLEVDTMFTAQEIQKISKQIDLNNNVKHTRKEMAMQIKLYKRFHRVEKDVFLTDNRNLADLYFAVSEPIYCYGFGIYGPTVDGLELISNQTVTATLQNDICSVIKIKTMEFEYDGTDKLYEILFEKPLLLNSSGYYYVIINFEDFSHTKFENYVGKMGLEEEEIDGVMVKYRHTKDNFGSTAARSRLVAILMRKFIE